MRTNQEQLVRHLQERYTYDAECGVVRNRRGRVIKGFNDYGGGYLTLNMRMADGRHVIKLHQLVWVLCHGELPTQIDHINGQKKDNRVENLREVNRSENDMNRVFAWKPNARTGLPGVQKSSNRFEISIHGKRLNFRDKHEAFHTLVMLGRMYKEY
ncbi:MAG: HNH endonuclease [Prevotella sp.]|nr:HNH endonuclease [Prevotella sp.]